MSKEQELQRLDGEVSENELDSVAGGNDAWSTQTYRCPYCGAKQIIRKPGFFEISFKQRCEKCAYYFKVTIGEFAVRLEKADD